MSKRLGQWNKQSRGLGPCHFGRRAGAEGPKSLNSKHLQQKINPFYICNWPSVWYNTGMETTEKTTICDSCGNPTVFWYSIQPFVGSKLCPECTVQIESDFNSQDKG